MDKTLFVYVLDLEHDKYYVGKTTNVEQRLKQHQEGIGSNWTKKYKCIGLNNVFSNCDVFDEDKYTIMMMNQFGINNVRGGSFNEIELSDSDIYVLEKMMRSVNDFCQYCGKKGHFMNKCIKMQRECENCLQHFKSYEAKKRHICCYHCGKSTHLDKDCPHTFNSF